MSEITCIRLLHESSKSEGLLASIRAIREAAPNPSLFSVESSSFNQVPNAPFSYAIGDEVRRLFSALPPFESEERVARVGLQTGDDFRFVRCWWEIPETAIRQQDRIWAPFAKGGAYSPYYADLLLVVNWGNDGAEIKEYPGARPQNTSFYRSQGLTWSEATTKEFGCRPLMAGSVFGHVGLGIIQKDVNQLLQTMVVLNSPQLRALMGIITKARADEAAAAQPAEAWHP